MKKDEIAKKIDHTLLKADATEKEIKKLCEEALEYGFASVCVNSYYVPLVAEVLSGSKVKTCSVVGFPLGAMNTETKVFETKWVIEKGASEVDMVINIGELKSGNADKVFEDIKAVVDIAKKTNKDTIVKVIIETCLLTKREFDEVEPLT